MSVALTQATLSTLLPLVSIPINDYRFLNLPEERMFLTLTPTMPRMELETMQPIEGFAVDVALKQASKDHVPELVDSNSGVTGVSNSRIGISEIPPAVKSDALGMDTLFKEASPVNATPGDLKPHGTHTHSVEDPLTKELDNHVNGNTASKADPLTKETNNHVNGNIDSRADPLAKETNNHINETIDSGADPLTKETNNHVNGNTTSSSSAGFMDKVDPPPTVTEGFVVDIPASPATRLKLRLENTKDLIVCPGVYDGLSARIALSVGCDAMYMVTEPSTHGDRRADDHSDWCWDHRFSPRHGRPRCGHTH